VALLSGIPRPTKSAALLPDLPLRLVFEYPRLDSGLLSTQEALLDSFRGVPNFMARRRCEIVSSSLLMEICL
jgi:hypothetical protein